MAGYSSRCVLGRACLAADSERCNALCTPYVAMHGSNGLGGRVALAGVPERYRYTTLLSSPVRADKPDLYTLLDDVARSYSRQFDPIEALTIKSLYLYSAAPGTGKTTSAAALLNEWLITHYIGSLKRNLAPIERPAYFLDVNAWQGDYNAFNRPRVPDEIAEPAAAAYYQAQLIARAVPFLVLDDVGVREASTPFRADLHTLINDRVTNGLVTVYTSNIRLSDMDTLFDGRLSDRMREMTIEITFKGASKRGIGGGR